MESDHIRGYLISVKKNGENGCSYAVRNPICYIGRDTNCDIRIRDENVNDRHCSIRIESAKKIIVKSLCTERPVLIEDIRNIEGTKIYNEKIASADGTEIQDGTLIKILDYTFRWVNVEPKRVDTVQRLSYLSNEKVCPRKSLPILYQPKITDENENSQVNPTERDEIITTATEKDKSTAIENVSMNPKISSTIKDSVISTSMSMSPTKNSPSVSLSQSICRRSLLYFETLNGKTESGDYEKCTSPTPSRLSHLKTPNSPLQESNRSSLAQSGRRSYRKLSVDVSNTFANTMSNDSINKSTTDDVSFAKSTNDNCTRPASNCYEDVTLEECKETTISNEKVLVTPETRDNDVSNTEKSVSRTSKSFINAFHSTPNYSRPEKTSFLEPNSKTTDVAATSETTSEMYSAVTSFTNDNACASTASPSINGSLPVANKEETVAEDESAMRTPPSPSNLASRCRRSTIEPMVGTPSDVYRVTKCFVTPGSRFHFNRTSLEVQTSNVAEASRRSERKSTPMKAEKTSVRDSLLLYSPIIENQKGEEEQREDEPFKFVSRRKPRFGRNSFADENRIVEENETINGETVDDSLQPLDSFEQEDASVATKIAVDGETDALNSTFDIANEDEEADKTFDVDGEQTQTTPEEEKSLTVTKSVPRSILTPLPRQQLAKTIKKVTFTGLNENETDTRPTSPYSPQETVDDMSVSGVSCTPTETSVVSEANKTTDEDDERLYQEDEPSELGLEVSSAESIRSKSISPRRSSVKRPLIAVKSPKDSLNLSGIKTLMETPVSEQATPTRTDIPKIRVLEPTPAKGVSADASFASPMVRRCSRHLRIHRNSVCQVTETTPIQPDESDAAPPTAADCSASLNNSVADAPNVDEERAKEKYDRVIVELNERLARELNNRGEVEERPIEDEKTSDDEMAAAQQTENEIVDEEFDRLEVSIDESLADEPVADGTNVTETRADDAATVPPPDETPISTSSPVAQNSSQPAIRVSVRFEGVLTPDNVESMVAKRVSTPYVRASLCENLTPVGDYSIVEEAIAATAQCTPRNDGGGDQTPTTTAVAPIVVRTASPPPRQTLLTPARLNNDEVTLSSAVVGSVSAAVQHIRTSTPLWTFAANKGIDPKTFYAAKNEGTITELSGISVPSSGCQSPTTQASCAESTMVLSESAVENIIKTERVTRESSRSDKSPAQTTSEKERTNATPASEANKTKEPVEAASNDETTSNEDRKIASMRAESASMVAEEKIEADSIKPESTPAPNKYKMEVILRGARQSAVIEKVRSILVSQGMDADIVNVKQLENEAANETETVTENTSQESRDESAEKRAEQAEIYAATKEHENATETAKETTATIEKAVDSATKEAENEMETTEETTTTRRKKRKAATTNSQTGTTVNRSTRRTKNETKTELQTHAEMPVNEPKLVESEDTASNERPRQTRTIRSKKKPSDANMENADDDASNVREEVAETKSKRPKRNATVKAETVAAQPAAPTKNNAAARNSVDAAKTQNAGAAAEIVVEATKARQTRNSTSSTKGKNDKSSTTPAIDTSTGIEMVATVQKPVVEKKTTRNTRRVKTAVDDSSVASVADVPTKAPTKTRAASKSAKNKVVDSEAEIQPTSKRNNKRTVKIAEERKASIEPPSQAKQTKSQLASESTEVATTSSKVKNASAAVVAVGSPAAARATRNKRKIAAETVTPQLTKTTTEEAAASSKMNKASSAVAAVSSPPAVKATRNKRKIAAETVTPQLTTASTMTTRSKRKLNADSEIKASSGSAKSVNEPATKRRKLVVPVAVETNTRSRSTRSSVRKK